LETDLLLLTGAAVEIDQVVVAGDEESCKYPSEELGSDGGVVGIPIVAPAKIMLKPGLN